MNKNNIERRLFLSALIVYNDITKGARKVMQLYDVYYNPYTHKYTVKPSDLPTGYQRLVDSISERDYLNLTKLLTNKNR